MQEHRKKRARNPPDSTGEEEISLVIAQEETQEDQQGRSDALSSQDAVSYFMICEEQGVEPEDPELFERGQLDAMLEEKAESTLTDFTLEKLAGTAEREKRVPKCWGIRKKDLQSLDYRILENIFYGMYNLKIPVEVLDRLNPDEILSKWNGAGVLKKHNSHLKRTLPQNFYAIYRALDEQSYSESAFRNMSSGCNKQFPSHTGEQKRRLGGISDGARRCFIDSFFRKYIHSTQECPTDPAAFHDPNADGCSKEVYVNSIYRMIKQIRK